MSERRVNKSKISIGTFGLGGGTYPMSINSDVLILLSFAALRFV